jgi:hypothetical protein
MKMQSLKVTLSMVVLCGVAATSFASSVKAKEVAPLQCNKSVYRTHKDCIKCCVMESYNACFELEFSQPSQGFTCMQNKKKPSATK